MLEAEPTAPTDYVWSILEAAAHCLQTLPTRLDKAGECAGGNHAAWPRGRDQMGPNSSFLLLISMIILSCHTAYVFFFFFKSKGRI